MKILPHQTAIRFHNPETAYLGDHIRSSAKRGLELAKPGREDGKPGAVICGLGSSLTTPDVLEEVRKLAAEGWVIVALKEAIGFLMDNKIQVNYAVNMDPQAQEAERLPQYDSVTYCLASSCHPHVYDVLLEADLNVLVYHSACGYFELEFTGGFVLDLLPDTGQKAIVLGEYALMTGDNLEFCPVAIGRKDEWDVYREKFGGGDTMTGGFTCANRAMALMAYMGVPEIVLAGCDFGWRDGDAYYADYCDFPHQDEMFMGDQGRLDGKPWHTRPDLLASAVDVAKKVKQGGVRVLGDSIAASLSLRDDEYLDWVCTIR